MKDYRKNVQDCRQTMKDDGNFVKIAGKQGPEDCRRQGGTIQIVQTRLMYFLLNPLQIWNEMHDILI